MNDQERECDFEFTFEYSEVYESPMILIEDHRWSEPRGLYMAYTPGDVWSIWRAINTLLRYAKEGEAT